MLIQILLTSSKIPVSNPPRCSNPDLSKRLSVKERFDPLLDTMNDTSGPHFLPLRWVGTRIPAADEPKLTPRMSKFPGYLPLLGLFHRLPALPALPFRFVQRKSDPLLVCYSRVRFRFVPFGYRYHGSALSFAGEVWVRRHL